MATRDDIMGRGKPPPPGPTGPGPGVGTVYTDAPTPGAPPPPHTGKGAKNPGGGSTPPPGGGAKNPGGGSTPPPPDGGGPWQMQDWYGDNPLATAEARAKSFLGQQMAGISSRMGSMGMGNSSREALMRGAATAESATGLADVLAQRGLGAYASDADRALLANQQLMNAGVGLTGLGSGEQQIPGLAAIMNLLGLLSGQDIYGGSNQAGSGGWWTS